MMHGGLSVGEPSLLEITDNQNSMEAADRQLHPIPSLILNNFSGQRPDFLKRSNNDLIANVDLFLNYFDAKCIKIVNKRNLFLRLCIAIDLYNEEKENNDLYTLNIINLIFYKL